MSTLRFLALHNKESEEKMNLVNLEYILIGMLVFIFIAIAWEMVYRMHLQIGYKSRPISAWVGQFLPFRPRFINKIYAIWHHFFWLECDICGDCYGGHEWKDGHEVRCGGRSIGVCPKSSCKKEADKLTAILTKPESRHHVLDHPLTDADKYYQAYCNGCGWCGCSCQLGESKYPAGDSDVHCPVCTSMDID